MKLTFEIALVVIVVICWAIALKRDRDRRLEAEHRDEWWDDGPDA